MVRRLTVFLALTPLSLATVAQGGEAKPVRIGILLPFTGPFGIYGNPMETTLKARFAKVGSKVNGRPIELVFEDEATDAKTAVSKATKLIERKHVNAIVCCILK